MQIKSRKIQIVSLSWKSALSLTPNPLLLLSHPYSIAVGKSLSKIALLFPMGVVSSKAILSSYTPLVNVVVVLPLSLLWSFFCLWSSSWLLLASPGRLGSLLQTSSMSWWIDINLIDGGIFCRTVSRLTVQTEFYWREWLSSDVSRPNMLPDLLSFFSHLLNLLITLFKFLQSVG